MKLLRQVITAITFPKRRNTSDNTCPLRSRNSYVEQHLNTSKFSVWPRILRRNHRKMFVVPPLNVRGKREFHDSHTAILKATEISVVPPVKHAGSLIHCPFPLSFVEGLSPDSTGKS